MGSSRKSKFNFISSKFWSTKWIEYKKKLRLNSTQKSLLVGSLLGDGTLRVGKEAINANLKIEHGLLQKEYVFWKYEILKNWVPTPPKISYRYKEDTKEKYEKSWWFRTVRHPEITEFWSIFYLNGKKVIPLNIDKFLSPLVLAVWVMDDGSFNKNKLDLSTYSFSLNEIKLLQKALNSKFNIESYFYRDRDKGYRMYFTVANTQKLSHLIRPYIITSMEYKLPITP